MKTCYSVESLIGMMKYYIAYYLEINSEIILATNLCLFLSVHIPSRNYESMLPDLVKTYITKKAVIFHCMQSEIRGPKCAAMFKEMLPARHPTKM